MKKLSIAIFTLVLFSCGNNEVEKDGISAKHISNVEQPVKNKQPSQPVGTVTELHPENNIRFKKIILAAPLEFKERYDIGSSLIDVRSPEKFAKGHISGAVNIELSDPDFANKALELKNELPILVYSQKGVKSQEATHKLESAGFKKIYNLDGGYEAWMKAGL